MRPPFFFAFSSRVSMRGALVPGCWPTTMIRSACSMSSMLTVALPMPIVCVSARVVDSWHMFEQSGRLFVPSERTSSW